MDEIVVSLARRRLRGGDGQGIWTIDNGGGTDCGEPTTTTTTTQLPLLNKSCRVGGPVTCVSLHSNGTILWGLGPYLKRQIIRDHHDDDDDDDEDDDDEHCDSNQAGAIPKGAVKQEDELLVFPQDCGGILHGIRYRFDPSNQDHPDGQNKHGANEGNETDEASLHDDDDDWDAVVFGGTKIVFCQVLSNGTHDKHSVMMKRFSLHTTTISTGSTDLQPLLTLSDWIWDLKCIRQVLQNTSPLSTPQQDRTTLVVGMAKDRVEIWNVTTTKSITKTSIPPSSFSHACHIHVVCQQSIQGMAHSMVTCMDFFVPSSAHMLWVAAGTVFEKIQVWSLDLHPLHDTGVFTSEQQGDPTVPRSTVCTTTTTSLEGHAGSIHSVQFSSTGLCLASASDDRSVRLWQRSTIIMDSSSSTTWKSVWVGWGHTARIWSLAFTAANDSMVVSVAEDGTLRVWSVAKGQTLACIAHPCSIWTVDTYHHCENGTSNCNVAMVGATDGTVAVYNLSRKINPAVLDKGMGSLFPVSIGIPDDRPQNTVIVNETNGTNGDNQPHGDCMEITNLSKKRKKKKRNVQVLVGLQWLDRSNIILATRAGSIMMLNVDQQEWNLGMHSWYDQGLLDHYGILPTDGCCMRVRNGQWCAVGTTQGDIVVCSTNQSPTKQWVLPGKSRKAIQGLEWIQNDWLVAFHVRSVAGWAMSDTNFPTEPMWQLQVDTKGVPICCAYDERLKQVLVGDSRGGLSLYQLPNERVGLLWISATSTLSRVHGTEHITSVVLRGDRIFSGGNDGCVHISSRHGALLRKGWSYPLNQITGITRLWYSETTKGQGNRFCASGYFGNTFRVVDAQTGYEYFSADTGGRQRIHDYWTEISGEILDRQQQIVVCMNHKEDGTNSLLFHREIITHENEIHKMLCFPSIQAGTPTHTETIFDATFFSLGKEAGISFLLTASEDCCSKVLCCQESHVSDSIPLTPQESCVRAVAASQVDSSSALLVVGGGKLALQFFLATVNETDAIVQTLDDLTFRLLGRGAARHDATMDHRINVVKAIPLLCSTRLHLVVAGDSNGNIHLYLVAEDGNTILTPSGLILPTSHRPILSLSLSLVETSILLAVGTTGGDVQVFALSGTYDVLQQDWSLLPENWKPRASYQAHQSGANAMCLTLKTMVGDEFVVSIRTGGDDQAIHCSSQRFRLAGQRDLLCHVSEDSRLTEEAASFSAIKGLANVSLFGTSYLVTAGYSQRLALWTTERQAGKEDSLQIWDSLPIDIGDVNCLATWTYHNRILLAVCGLGVELFSFGL